MHAPTGDAAHRRFANQFRESGRKKRSATWTIHGRANQAARNDPVRDEFSRSLYQPSDRVARQASRFWPRDHASLRVTPVGEPFVDAEDIADVAAAALTQPGDPRKLYGLTGPRASGFSPEISRGIKQNAD
jgi:hypothetical protein